MCLCCLLLLSPSALWSLFPLVPPGAAKPSFSVHFFALLVSPSHCSSFSAYLLVGVAPVCRCCGPGVVPVAPSHTVVRDATSGHSASRHIGCHAEGSRRWLIGRWMCVLIGAYTECLLDDTGSENYHSRGVHVFRNTLSSSKPFLLRFSREELQGRQDTRWDFPGG